MRSISGRGRLIAAASEWREAWSEEISQAKLL